MRNSDTIAVRGWLAIFATGVALVVCTALDEKEGFSEPYSPPDQSLAARIGFVCGCMLPVGLLLGPAALLRAKKAALLEARSKGGRIIPLIFGAFGLALFVTEWARWGPYTGEEFTFSRGLGFAVA